jgi:hypothetical protein
MSEGIPLSRTTFNRHKDAIEDIFGIYIDCDRRDGYFILMWNPAISSVTIHDHIDSIAYIDDGDFNWSKGHSGTLLTDAQARKLEEVFANYLQTVRDKVDGENLNIL